MLCCVVLCCVMLCYVKKLGSEHASSEGRGGHVKLGMRTFDLN